LGEYLYLTDALIRLTIGKYLALLCLFFTGAVIGQEPYSLTIDKSKGLISENVYDIFQDSKGFIWIAHDEGLSRYDGVNFKNYSSPFQSSKGGSCIREDLYGRIWYENFDGYFFYIEHDSLKALPDVKPVGFCRFGIIGNKLLTIQNKGIYIYNLHTLKLHKKIPINLTYYTSAECSNGRYYLIMTNVFEFDSNGAMTIIPNFKSEGKWPGGASQAKHKVLLYDRNNSMRANYQVGQNACFKKFNMPFEGFIQTESYTDSCYWFCTSDGVYGFTESGTPLNNGEPYFRNKSISRVLKDKEGNFWFGTTNGGVLFVPDLNTRVFSYPFAVVKLKTAGADLLAGTKSGQVYLMPGNSMQPRLLMDNQVNKEILYLDYDSISDLIYSTSNRFFAFNRKGQECWKSEISIKQCVRTANGYFAFSATGVSGLLTFDKTLDLRKSPCFKSTGSPSGNLEVSHFVDGARGKATAYDGATATIYYSLNTGTFLFKNCALTETRVNGQRFYVSEFQQNDTSVVALSTQGKLYRLHHGIASELNYTKNQPDLLCQDIRLSRGYLFVSTSQGLFFSAPGELYGKFRPLGVNFSGSKVYDMEVNNGVFHAAIGQGIVNIPLNKLEMPVPGADFIVNHIKANNRQIQSGSQLEYTENNINIDYSVICFRNTESENVFYKINDGEWIKTVGKLRALSLAALSPGDYKITFSTGLYGPDTENTTEVTFTILQPWWLTKSFILSSILLALLAFFGVYWWQTGLLRRQNQLLTQKFELEKNLRQSVLKSIKAQMNPHFFYNALNTIQSFIFTDDKRSASTYLSKFSKLTRTILEMSEKENVTLAEEIEALTLYLDIEKVRFDNDFNFEITKPQNINPELIRIPSMLIQPYVENAIKHGLLHKKGNKQLHLKFEFENGLLTVLVSDNGIGRQRSYELNKIKQKKHSSFATQANSTRLSILNKDEARVGVEFVDKKDALGNAEGTDVILRIPTV